MNIFKNQIRNSSVLVSGLLVLSLGTLLFFETSIISGLLIQLNRYVLMIIGLFQFVVFLLENQKLKKTQHLWNTGYLLIINVLLWRIPEMQIAMIPLVYGVWALISAISKSMIYYVYKIDDIRPRLWNLIDAIISVGFAFVLLFDPVPSMLRLVWVAGVYLIYVGLFQIVSGVQLVTAGFFRKRINHLFRLPLPNFIAMLYPQRVLKQLIHLGLEVNTVHKPLKPNQLEILFHMKGTRSDNLGHLDMIYQNKLYSYGAYDPKHRYLNNSLGDGVLIISDPQPYLDFCIRTEQKRMIGFVYDMDDQQASLFENRMQQLLDRSQSWIPAFKENDSLYYIQRLSSATKADFFKFTQGHFKTYFAFGTNCVELVDYFIKDKQLGLFRLNGIITPGAYFDFLNTAFQLQTDKITQRRTY
ncbi:MAG: hypothetical protein FD133_1022 [Erysipelotrichaceae bacterium]|nr:MAG: hypothetical protein FD179_71 [Erysipelotrichaceae bacterium]TXT18186.1 MAG: hypothetical protein FD133_1022 [Erysipelotrichaceae bacterium]